MKKLKFFKKYYPALIIISLFIILFIPKNAYAVPVFEDATVIAEEVNMRLRPDTSSPIVLQLDEGARIGVFEEEVEGWYRIIYGNYRGYISKEYVFLPSGDNMVGNCLNDNVGVKQNPIDLSTNVATLSAGEGVTIKDFVGEWYLIETLNGETGYVECENIKQSSAKTAVTLLKKGMSGAAVTNLQKELRSRGFFQGSTTGYFGDVTEEAVKSFQKAANISVDGVAGAKTLEFVYGDNDIKTTLAKKYGITNKIELSSWDTIKNIITRGSKFTITDIKTGISFTAYRFGGTLHADCEPLTAADTAKLNKIYNNMSYSNQARWNRRAVWVTIGSRTFAASIHGMPHMVDVISGNNFPGHFCVHFYGSKVHETGKVCPRHLAMIKYAYRKGQE
ncbi:MAG: SH3 domain-containing protein [Eubacteriales bacterium]